MVKKFTTIDLFAGIGGIRTGFEATGRFKTIFANDSDKYCKATYDLNFSFPELDTRDIREVAEKEVFPKFDVLLAGFPCQPFSIAGYRQGFEDDIRGTLFFEVYKIIQKNRPKAILLENVKNLEGHDGGKTFQTIKDSLEELGYTIHHSILNSMKHGNIPQNRERIYIVGFRDDVEQKNVFRFPSEVVLTKSVSDFLEMEPVEDKFYYTDRYPMYDLLKKAVVSQNTVYQWRRKYVRENKKSVCPTLTANMGTGGHNVPLVLSSSGIRKLTPKECFSLQGFPQDFRLPNIAVSQLYKQAGNSVTVSVVTAVAQKMLEILDGQVTIEEQIRKDIGFVHSSL